MSKIPKIFDSNVFLKGGIGTVESSITIRRAMDRAQERFEEFVLENSTVVYGHDIDHPIVWDEEKTSNDTRQARIILIEEIKKECTRHLPFDGTDMNLIWSSIGAPCKNCGKKIRICFEEVE